MTQNRLFRLLLFILLNAAFAGFCFASKIAIIQYKIQNLNEVGVDADRLETFIREAAGQGAEMIVANSQHQCKADQAKTPDDSSCLTKNDVLHRLWAGGVDDHEDEINDGVGNEHRDAKLGFVGGRVVLAQFYCRSMCHCRISS